MKNADFYVFDKNFDTVMHLDSYSSMLWTDRYDSPGDFELIVAPTDEALKYLVMDNYIWSNNSNTLMIIEQIEYKSSFDDGPAVIIKGRDLRSILDRRILLIKAIFKGNMEDSFRQILDYTIIDPFMLETEADGWSKDVYTQRVWFNDAEVIYNQYYNESFNDYLEDYRRRFPEKNYYAEAQWAARHETKYTNYSLDPETYVLTVTVSTSSPSLGGRSQTIEDESLKNFLGGMSSDEYDVQSANLEVIEQRNDYGLSIDCEWIIIAGLVKYRKRDYARRIENFTFEYSGDERINNLTIYEEFQMGANLSEVVTTMCKVHNCGYQVTLNDDKQFVFRVTIGDDHSYDQEKNPWIIFSPHHNNLKSNSFSYDKGTNYANFIYYADSDGHKAKVETGDRGLYRREHYASVQVNAAAGETFAQAGKDVLKEKAVSAKGEVEVESAFHNEYGVDYFIGDIVQVENEFGICQKFRVTEFITSYSTSGFEMYPTLTEVIDEEDEE